jgi:hypothetical protein
MNKARKIVREELMKEAELDYDADATELENLFQELMKSAKKASAIQKKVVEKYTKKHGWRYGDVVDWLYGIDEVGDAGVDVFVGRY